MLQVHFLTKLESPKNSFNPGSRRSPNPRQTDKTTLDRVFYRTKCDKVIGRYVFYRIERDRAIPTTVFYRIKRDKEAWSRRPGPRLKFFFRLKFFLGAPDRPRRIFYLSKNIF